MSPHPADSATLLSATAIEQLVQEELRRAQEQFTDWHHPFRELRFSHARRVLGQAHGDGTIKLSRLFIGTPAKKDLLDTIRHEFAHLIAGLRAGHGPRWKGVAQALGATPSSSGCSVCAALRERMDDAPFTLFAIMENGEEIALKPAWRRSRQYENYRFKTRGRQYFYQGQPVLAFRYRER